MPFTSPLKSLRQRAADLQHELNALTTERAAISDIAVRDKTAITDAQRARLLAVGTSIDAVNATMTSVRQDLAVAEEANERERGAEAIADADDRGATAAQRIGASRSNADATPARPGGRLWGELFPAIRRASNPWASESEFLSAVASGRADGRLAMQASVMSGSDSPQGLIVPDSMSAVWMNESLPSEIVRPRANNFAMPTRSRTIPAWDLSDRTNGDLAGLTLQWIGEGGLNTPQSAKPRIIVLTANKAAIYADVTSELLADGMGFDEQLRAILSRALGWGLDRSFLFGTGVAQPLGALVSNAAVSVTRTTPGTVVYEDLLAMYSRLVPSATDAVWLAAPSSIPALASLVLQIGAGGSAIPVMSQTDGNFRILTRPVVFTDLMKPTGTAGDVALCSFAGYNVGFRREVSIETSSGPGWYKDLVSFRVMIRADGQPSDATPIQPENSAPTQSHFIKLV